MTHVELHGPKTSFSAFKKGKRNHVLTFISHKYRECLCEYCANVDLKIQATTVNNIHDRYDSMLTLRPKKPHSDYHKTSPDRKCDVCGTKLLTSHLLSLLDDETKKSQPMSWYKWEIVKQGGYARLTKVKKDGTFEELVDALVQYFEAFSCHLFNGKWQWKALQFVEDNEGVRTCTYNPIYAYILVYHVTNLCMLYNGLRNFSAQGMEKLNDVVKSIHRQHSNKIGACSNVVKATWRQNQLTAQKRVT